MRLISQLNKEISTVLQKILKYFNGTSTSFNVISTSLVPIATVLPVIFSLNVNKAVLLLATGKSAIPLLSSKNVPSL